MTQKSTLDINQDMSLGMRTFNLFLLQALSLCPSVCVFHCPFLYCSTLFRAHAHDTVSLHAQQLPLLLLLPSTDYPHTAATVSFKMYFKSMIMSFLYKLCTGFL